MRRFLLIGLGTEPGGGLYNVAMLFFPSWIKLLIVMLQVTLNHLDGLPN